MAQKNLCLGLAQQIFDAGAVYYRELIVDSFIALEFKVFLNFISYVDKDLQPNPVLGSRQETSNY